jgi:hypothetical protein
VRPIRRMKEASERHSDDATALGMSRDTQNQLVTFGSTFLIGGNNENPSHFQVLPETASCLRAKANIVDFPNMELQDTSKVPICSPSSSETTLHSPDSSACAKMSNTDFSHLGPVQEAVISTFDDFAPAIPQKNGQLQCAETNAVEEEEQTQPCHNTRICFNTQSKPSSDNMPQKSASDNHNDFSALTVVELRELCRSKDLRVQGSKHELVARLCEIASPDAAGAQASATETPAAVVANLVQPASLDVYVPVHNDVVLAAAAPILLETCTPSGSDSASFTCIENRAPSPGRPLPPFVLPPPPQSFTNAAFHQCPPGRTLAS